MNGVLQKNVLGFIHNTLRFYINGPQIEKLINSSKVVVFMKGVPDDPRCGFSNAVVQVLQMHGVKYNAFNVLEDDKIRQGVKEYTNWPTIPQVFINGHFVGGCDILIQMHKSGLLIEELEKVGIISPLLTQARKEEVEKKKRRLEAVNQSPATEATKQSPATETAKQSPVTEP